MSDELIEAMARIIDPRAWAESARLIGRADDWALRGKPGGVDFEKMYRSQAVEAVSDSLSRARALLPVIRAHLEPTSEMVEAACRVRPASHMWPDRYTDSLQAFERKFAKAAIIAALAASPIGDVG